MRRPWRALSLLGFGGLALTVMPSCKIQQTGRADSLAAGDAAADQRRLSSEVRFAVTVARALRAHPDSATTILEANRLTRPGLDSLLYDIAVDPALAAAYDRGIGRPDGDELD